MRFVILLLLVCLAHVYTLSYAQTASTAPCTPAEMSDTSNTRCFCTKAKKNDPNNVCYRKINSSCTLGDKNNPPGFDCYLKFHRYLKKYDGDWKSPVGLLEGKNNCRIINPSDFDLTNLYPRPGEALARGHMQDWVTYGLGISSAVVTAGAAAAAIVGGPLIIGVALAAAASYTAYLNYCTYSFVFAPQEYYAWKVLNKNPLDSDRTYSDEMPDFYSMPNYFHCNPAYRPEGIQFDNGSSSTLNRTIGYPGPASTYCSQGINSRYQMPDMVNKIAVGIQTPSEVDLRVAFGTYEFGSIGWIKGKTQVLEISPNDRPRVGKNQVYYVAYYRIQSNESPKICAGIVSFAIPVEVGCTTATFINDYTPLPTKMQNFVNGTRCAYLYDMRSDLASLANSGILSGGDGTTPTGRLDSDGYSSLALAKFLRSDLHITSNVVGCIKDILIKKFVSDPSSPGSRNYFQLLQAQISPILYAVFLLYVSLLGIKIISSNQPPSRGESILYIFKLAIVAYFTLGDGWYSQDPNRPGLFVPIVYASDQISDLFLQAFNSNDQAGMCRFKYGTRNILSEREIAVSSSAQVGSSNQSLAATAGFPNAIKLSVWDLLDCHIANYLTYGSCEYTAGSLAAIWLITIGFFTAGIGSLVAIISFIYVVMIFLVVFRFTHTYILCLFSIAILILISPIFLCFSLFEPTKQAFQAWVKMLFNNILYPALLFSFLALMLTAFNAVYYGNLNTNPQSPQNFHSACRDSNGKAIQSMFCASILNFVKPGEDVCKISWNSNIRDRYFDNMSVPPFGNFPIMKRDGAMIFLKNLPSLLVIAIIFYHFSNEVMNFFTTLLSMQTMSSYARGRVNLVGAAAKSASAAYSAGKVAITPAAVAARGVWRRIR